MRQINTVNVVEYFDDTIQSLRSFPNTVDGNKYAEKLFLRCCKCNGAYKTDAEWLADLENGYWEHDSHDYQVFITHSIID